MSSKTFELYDEVLFQLKRFIEKYSGFKNFQEIKVMCDFEIPLRKAIKENFPGCILQGCFFHFCKAIWAKINNLNLFKKNMRRNTILIAFILKSYPFIKNERREIYCKKITDFCLSLGGEYP